MIDNLWWILFVPVAGFYIYNFVIYWQYRNRRERPVWYRPGAVYGAIGFTLFIITIVLKDHGPLSAALALGGLTFLLIDSISYRKARRRRT